MGFKQEDILWGVGKSKEYYIYDKNNKRTLFYDFTIPKIKLILEFHGIGFHPNPVWNTKTWNNWKSVYNGFSAEFKYKSDIYKRKYAENNNFKVIEIYSDNVKNKQIEIINNINNINDKN